MQVVAQPQTVKGGDQLSAEQLRLAEEAARFAAQYTQNVTKDKLAQVIASFHQPQSGQCVAEIEINDYPQKARWAVTNKVFALFQR